MMNDMKTIELSNNGHVLENPQELFNQLDHRGFNLLMIAAENGRNDEIVKLLSIGFDINSSIGPHTAASLAYQRRHYDSLLILLNANSKFPSNFNAEATQHAGLIAFNAQMNQFHEHLFSGELTELQNIINSHRHLRYFFNSGDGHSAAFEALSNMIINCYELLVCNNILLSPDEDFNEAISSLTDDQKEQVRVIHERHAVPLPNNHLMIIHGSIFVGHDINEADRIHRLNTAQDAINFLNEIPQIQPILKLIARAGGFKIIFDFNRESIQFMAPKSNRETHGLFCTTRHIYIAAKNLLNDDNQMEVYGTMAHELCHFAMDLTYNNICKPYNEADRETIGQEFHQILLQSRQQNVGEDIVNAVWSYPDESQFAELIVRVPHMMAFYANNQPILYLRNQQFQPLFKFYQTRVLPDINNKIPTINAEMNQMRANFYDQTLKKVSKWRKTAKIALGFAPIGIIITALLTYFIVFMPNISYYELSPEDQLKVIYGNVKFFNVNLKFNELFNEENTQLLNSLNSIQLWTLIDGEILDLNDQTNAHLRNDTVLIYSNMTDSLKQKLKDGKVNFQGEIITVRQLIGDDENSSILSKLNFYQVRELFFNILSVGKIPEIKTTFYMQRDFIEYNTEVNTKWNSKLSKYVWTKQVLDKLKTFDQISTIADDEKMILLSDKAGAGKTTTFKHIAVKLKEKYPDYWISYIDLKRHLDVYEKFEQNIQPIEVLKKILSITDEFEAEIFTKLFNSDKVILLYDGVDEIAPKFKDFFIKFIANVRNSTRNQQWIATRPQHTKELMTEFKQTAYKLMPYDNDQRIELIQNVLKDLNVENINAKEINHNINDGIIITLQKFDSPLIPQMITKLYVKDQTILDYSNLFSLYDKMIDMKMDIVGEKGEIVSKDRDNRKAKMTIWEVHQIYALKLIFGENSFIDYFNENRTIDINEFQLLKRWKTEKSKWTPEAISRYGLLTVDDWNTEREFPDFIHRTFAEFLVAQFLIEDLYELNEDDDSMSEKDIELRANFLIEVSDTAHYAFLEFHKSFFASHKSKRMHKYFTKLITSNGMQNVISGKRKMAYDLRLDEIFSIDVRFLKEFRFNDNKTIIQDILNTPYFTTTVVECFYVYEKSLGKNWIHYTGYSFNENFSVPSDNEIDEIYNQDFDESFELMNDNLKKSFRVFYKIAYLLIQAKMPQEDVSNIYKTFPRIILKYSFHSSTLISKLWKTIEIYFNDCKVELLKILNDIKIIPDYELPSSEKYIENAIEFLKELEHFLRLDETNNFDDIRISIVSYYTRFYGLKYIIGLYKERKRFFDNEYSYEDFLKNKFDNESELLKLLDMRDENNHNVFNYLDELISDKNVETEKILILTKDFLINLAKKNGISKDEIDSFLKKKYD